MVFWKRGVRRDDHGYGVMTVTVPDIREGKFWIAGLYDGRGTVP